MKTLYCCKSTFGIRRDTSSFKFIESVISAVFMTEDRLVSKVRFAKSPHPRGHSLAFGVRPAACMQDTMMTYLTGTTNVVKK
jgi:hypothetical protein